jgi:hypothetical protein
MNALLRKVGPAAASAALAAGLTFGIEAAVAPPTQVTQLLFAGYQLDGVHSSATASISVPTISCTATETMVSAWMGISGGSFLQGGSLTYCYNDKPTYVAFVEWFTPTGSTSGVDLYGGGPQVCQTGQAACGTVQPGDTIAVDITGWSISLADPAEGWTYAVTPPGLSGAGGVVQWFVEDPDNGIYPLAQFSQPVAFSGTADGSVPSSGLEEWTMSSTATQPGLGSKATPSGWNNGSFTVAYGSTAPNVTTTTTAPTPTTTTTLAPSSYPVLACTSGCSDPQDFSLSASTTGTLVGVCVDDSNAALDAYRTAGFSGGGLYGCDPGATEWIGYLSVAGVASAVVEVP